MKHEIDINSSTWKAVDEKAKHILKAAKRATEARGVPERDADFERGRIAATREILKLADPPSSQPVIAKPLQY